MIIYLYVNGSKSENDLVSRQLYGSTTIREQHLVVDDPTRVIEIISAVGKFINCVYVSHVIIVYRKSERRLYIVRHILL